MSNKPWAIGAWAAEAEREEEEQRALEAAEAAAAANAKSAAPAEAFPTIGESLAFKPTKKQGYGGVSMVPRPYHEQKGLTPPEMMMLPTGPRERSAEEQQRGGLGGGFRDYGASYRDYGPRGPVDRVDRGRSFESGGFRDRQPLENPNFLRENPNFGAAVGGAGFYNDRRASGAGFEFDRRASGPGYDMDRRASTAGFDYGRRASLAADRQMPPPPPSRADEVGNWGLVKKSLPLVQYPPARRESFDGGRIESFDSSRQYVRPDDGNSGGFSRKLDSTAQDALPPAPPKPKPNPFGAARPREEVLAERSRPQEEADFAKPDGPKDSRPSSRPSSSHSSRPQTPEIMPEPAPRPKPKVNPFGDAKPREVVLQEQGKDWRKLDFELEHKGVDRPETEEEALLKEEIKRLKELSIQAPGAEHQGINGAGQDIESQLQMKEKELENLTRSLDDKVRFSQKGSERPRSRSGGNDVGKSSDLLEGSGSRPGSRSGRSDLGRHIEQLDRPRSQSGRRIVETVDRTRSRSAYGVRGQDAAERERQQESGRMGMRSGSFENKNSFNSLQRSRWRSSPTATVGRNIPEYMVAGGGGAEVWTRSNDSAENM